VILEGCGHVPHREQPARVLTEVVQFLDRQSESEHDRGL
jgi:pimeloyl-ACP methyl ester carboxylesterase